mmetsp:Transcript_48871/g.123989  ORF Transcript_48871/g.123989 Transcript_48871/m.123989 type:complete len:218 (+) Transcript_48871:383-1036(+)
MRSNRRVALPKAWSFRASFARTGRIQSFGQSWRVLPICWPSDSRNAATACQQVWRCSSCCESFFTSRARAWRSPSPRMLSLASCSPPKIHELLSTLRRPLPRRWHHCEAKIGKPRGRAAWMLSSASVRSPRSLTSRRLRRVRILVQVVATIGLSVRPGSEGRSSVGIRLAPQTWSPPRRHMKVFVMLAASRVSDWHRYSLRCPDIFKGSRRAPRSLR